MTAAPLDDLRPILGIVASGTALTAAQTEAAFGIMMKGHATPAQVGALLLAMRVRGETTEEITGAARAMRAHMLAVTAPAGTIDCCGTGGDASGTLNISTAVAFVAAGCGVPVAKHGNRAMSSRSGAADVLEALGVNIEAPLDGNGYLDDHGDDHGNGHGDGHGPGAAGVRFLFAPRHHAAIRHVSPSRRELGTRTIFNLLGPLANPANARRQLLGVFGPQWVGPVAEALRALGSECAWVVHGHDGLDELTTTTHSAVAQLRDGVITRFEVTPEQAGLPLASLDDLRGGDARDNAAALRALLDGRPGPYRDIVVLNAAAALIVAGKAGGLREGARMAQDAIESGAAAAQLRALVRATSVMPARVAV